MTCGAPLDVANKVSDSGWREAPKLRDMTEFRFSASTCQVEGELVPVAEINLSPQDGVYFEHHVMLWKDQSVPLSSLKTSGGAKRSLGGMPHIVTVANGPGRIAFSHNAAGEDAGEVLAELTVGVEVRAGGGAHGCQLGSVGDGRPGAKRVLGGVRPQRGAAHAG